MTTPSNTTKQKRKLYKKGSGGVGCWLHCTLEKCIFPLIAYSGGVRWGMLVKGGEHLLPSWPQYTWAVTPSLLVSVIHCVYCALCTLYFVLLCTIGEGKGTPSSILATVHMGCYTFSASTVHFQCTVVIHCVYCVVLVKGGGKYPS